MSCVVSEAIVLTLLLTKSISVGSRDESAGGAVARMGRGHPGWGSGPALGEAVVPGSITGRHNNPVHVSLWIIACIRAIC